MVVEAVFGDVIAESICAHCGEAIEMFSPADNRSAYWRHPRAPMDALASRPGETGISTYCRRTRAEPT